MKQNMSTQTDIPRAEHPRPDFMRDTFLNLNGAWQFAFDDRDEGLTAGWQRPGTALPMQITVPFAYQTKLSGIGPTDEIHPILWYRRGFEVPADMADRRILLRFGAVDYQCDVFVNGQMVGSHAGGYTPFGFDITHALRPGENDLCLRVVDEPDFTRPRGKQYWERGLMGCWYTPVSGIWQTVYLEAVGDHHMTQIHITPDIDRHLFTAEIALDRLPVEGMALRMDVSFEGRSMRSVTATVSNRVSSVPVDLDVRGALDTVRLWSPERPDLYDVEVTLLRDGAVIDRVRTYFGMRKVEVRDGRVYLNNCPLYQRLVLDQGYWPDSNITPPSDEAIRRDVEAAKAFGFNGARKHQKLEDPRYYYWADRLGLLVWGEVPSPYDFTDEMVRELAGTLSDFIDRDFNHPSIITWVPINESWGVRQIYTDKRQQATGRMLYHLTKALDGTRLCSTNDGWEQVETDICALHDYAAEGRVIDAHFADRNTVETHACDWRPAFAQGETPTGREAFMVTEYGGIAFESIGLQGELGGMETWGYHDKVTDAEAFFQRFQSVTDAIRAIPFCQGWCYTQLTDVMQEINGLMTPDRVPKLDVARFAKLNVNPVGRN